MCLRDIWVTFDDADCVAVLASLTSWYIADQNVVVNEGLAGSTRAGGRHNGH